MNEFGVRKENSSEITTIRCADRFPVYCIVETIVKDSDYTIRLEDGETKDSLVILDKSHALNVIKGIQKAIELGWVK